VQKVLPFDSSTVTLFVTGQQLLQVLENSASMLPGTAGRFLQVSGLTVTYDVSSPPGSRVQELSVGGRPLDRTRRYSVTTDLFLADGGDGYTIFTNAERRIERQIPIRDILLEALQDQALVGSVEGRIRFSAAGRS
jgi:5'-nucleotidase